MVVFAAYVLLTVVMSWPVVPRITTHLARQGGDLWVHRWNLWWLKRCLLGGENPFYTDYILHPYGVSMIYHDFAWVHSSPGCLCRPSLALLLGSMLLFWPCSQ